MHKVKMHHRKLLRLKGYDYSSAGLYFITICFQDRVCRYGHVENGNMILNEFGQIANDEWIKLENRFENFELDVIQIMPNHIHGIIKLNAPPTGSGFNPDQNETPDQSDQNESNAIKTSNKIPTISDIVGAYKSLVSNNCLEIYKIRNQMMG